MLACVVYSVCLRVVFALYRVSLYGLSFMFICCVASVCFVCDCLYDAWLASAVVLVCECVFQMWLCVLCMDYFVML